MSTEATMEKNSVGQADVERTRHGQSYRPNVDILESAEELVLIADLPGVKADGVNIHFEDGELTIHGLVATRYPEGANCLLCEYGVGDFYRTFRVSEQIDSTKIRAEFRNGVLQVHLPKIEAVKPRKIQVATG